MEITKTGIDGLLVIQPTIYDDSRGFFFESWSKVKLAQQDIFYDFVQDNHSFSQKKGTLRGLHFQKGECAQAKLMRCVRGSITDVAVDLRCKSTTYKQWFAVELNAKNNTQLLIPRGFAHGFITLEDNTEVLYKADNCYSPHADGGIRWDDPEISVKWGISNPILSEKDASLPYLHEVGKIF